MAHVCKEATTVLTHTLSLSDVSNSPYLPIIWLLNVLYMYSLYSSTNVSDCIHPPFCSIWNRGNRSIRPSSQCVTPCHPLSPSLYHTLFPLASSCFFGKREQRRRRKNITTCPPALTSLSVCNPWYFFNIQDIPNGNVCVCSATTCTISCTTYFRRDSIRAVVWCVVSSSPLQYEYRSSRQAAY